MHDSLHHLVRRWIPLFLKLHVWLKEEIAPTILFEEHDELVQSSHSPARGVTDRGGVPRIRVFAATAQSIG